MHSRIRILLVLCLFTALGRAEIVPTLETFSRPLTPWETVVVKTSLAAGYLGTAIPTYIGLHYYQHVPEFGAAMMSGMLGVQGLVATGFMGRAGIDGVQELREGKPYRYSLANLGGLVGGAVGGALGVTLGRTAPPLATGILSTSFALAGYAGGRTVGYGGGACLDLFVRLLK